MSLTVFFFVLLIYPVLVSFLKKSGKLEVESSWSSIRIFAVVLLNLHQPRIEFRQIILLLRSRKQLYLSLSGISVSIKIVECIGSRRDTIQHLRRLVLIQEF